MKKLFSREFIIGICVLVALVILYFGINYLKGINLFKPGNYYTVEYDNIRGLETAAAVTIDGYKVGEVRKIDFNYEHHSAIKVSVALDKKLRVPVDSKAIITTSLLGTPSIVIIPGKSERMIEPGGMIPSGTEKGMLDAVGQDVMPMVTTLIPHIDSLVVNLNNTAQNIAYLSGKQGLENSVDNLEKITGDFSALASALNKSLSSQVPQVMGTAGEVATNINSITKDLMVVTNQLKQLPLNGTMQNVNELTGNLNKLSRDLNSGEGTLGKLLKDPSLYYHLNRVTADIDSLINDIKTNPKRYINVKVF